MQTAISLEYIEFIAKERNRLEEINLFPTKRGVGVAVTTIIHDGMT